MTSRRTPMRSNPGGDTVVCGSDLGKCDLSLGEPDVGLAVRRLAAHSRNPRTGPCRIDRNTSFGRTVAVFIDFAVVDDEARPDCTAVPARRFGQAPHCGPDPRGQLVHVDVS